MPTLRAEATFHRENVASARRVQNAKRTKRFLRLHIVIKPLNKKRKHNKFFIMLKRNSFNVN